MTILDVFSRSHSAQELKTPQTTYGFVKRCGAGIADLVEQKANTNSNKKQAWSVPKVLVGWKEFPALPLTRE